MRSIVCLLLFLITSGCSLFKNNTKTREEQVINMKNQSSFSSAGQKNWLKQTGSFSLFRDSSDASYSVQVWPRGAFSYSAENGFKGEAEKVIISGNSRNVGTAAFAENVKEQDQGKFTLKEQNKEILGMKENYQTTKESVSWKVIFSIVISLGLLVWLIVKYLK